jgi:hypothetical protein
LRTIEKIIEESIGKSKSLLKSIREFTPVLEKRQDSLIMDLKKRTYIL